MENKKIINNRYVFPDLLKGVGILFVIGGHCEFELKNFPSYSFHIPLFFFISGFFLNKHIEYSNFNKIEFIINKAKSLLIPYSYYNIIFGFITFILTLFGIPFANTSFLEIFSLKNLLIMPFGQGLHYAISCPLWFIPSLFIVMIYFSLTRDILKKCLDKKYTFAVVLLLIVSYYISIQDIFRDNIYLRTFARAWVGYVFCILGMLFYRVRDKLNYVFLISFFVVIYSFIATKFGLYTYIAALHEYGEGYQEYLSFLVSFSGIMIVTSGCFLWAKKLTPNNILLFFGKNSFHVMALHLSGFFILNIIIVILFPERNISDLSSIYYKYKNINWLYFVFGCYFSYYFIKLVLQNPNVNSIYSNILKNFHFNIYK